METTRRAMIGGGVAAAALAPAAVSAVTTAPTPMGAGRALKVPPPARFTPDWASLTAGYSVPDWFRDAKFGIWAHWTAQCVPEAGDWYAREMYLPGSRAYAHHLKHYGHPADVGFMEIQNLWKAERWDPARQLDLYQRAGARYFMALANHHDNLDTYASRYHPRNTTRVGPRKDIIGTGRSWHANGGCALPCPTIRPMHGTGTSPPMAMTPRGRAPASAMTPTS